MSAEIFLDARLMEPPEPLEKAMAALATLTPGQYFHMQHRMVPRMLYPQLAAMCLTEKTLILNREDVHIIVWAPADPAAAAAAAQCCAQLGGDIRN
ncbi:MAG: DUF2249 domain-containing protein [Pseudomonadales bacterium]|nr:DUF2249 domain-containing protein [Halioglobus sp.]MCP5194651.1 DUF2249 domain-containing protein [Pseudomonadales bacterium]